MGEYEDDLKGFAKKAVGRVEEEGGKVLNDREMEDEGNEHRLEGEREEIVAGSGRLPPGEASGKDDAAD